MRSVLFLGVLVSCLSVGCASPLSSNAQNQKQTSASWAVAYKTVGDMATSSDLIVRGTISDVTQSFTTRTSTLQIEHLYKGNNTFKGSILRVQQSGNPTGNTASSVDSTHPLTKGEQVVLCLKHVQDDLYVPLNEDSGVFVQDSAHETFQNVASKTSYTLQTLEKEFPQNP